MSIVDTEPKTVDDIYGEMVTEYNQHKSRLKLIEMMTDWCKHKKITKDQVFLLKKRMETEFPKDVNCQYRFFGSTPNNYGCDLRELFFKRNGDIIDDDDDDDDATKKRTKLLALFHSKKHHNIRHIMTDIDDTLFAHSAHGIAGEDKSWRQKIPFPGIIKFYQLFYSKLDENYKYSTVLSATPGLMKMERLNDATIKSILGPQPHGFIQGEESKISALELGVEIFARPSDAFNYTGSMKHRRCLEYSKIFPDYQLLFIGDNGQGDLIGGRKMLNDIPNCMVFIHEIVQKNGTLKQGLEPGEENPYPNRLFFFKNYLELGNIFKRLDIFNEEDITQLKTEVLSNINEQIEDICKDMPLSKCKQESVYKQMVEQYFSCGNDNCLNETGLKHFGGRRKRTKRCKYRKGKGKRRRTQKQYKMVVINNL